MRTRLEGPRRVNRVEYREEFWFPVTPDQLWVLAGRFDQFESWWGWLREFRTEQGGLVAGNVLHGTIIPPVPYRLRLDVRLERCHRPLLVDATVDGDLSGRAVLRLQDAGDGTRVAVAWSLEMRSVQLRLAARVAYPLLRWGHDRVVEMAVAGFRGERFGMLLRRGRRKQTAGCCRASLDPRPAPAQPCEAFAAPPSQTQPAGRRRPGRLLVKGSSPSSAGRHTGAGAPGRRAIAGGRDLRLLSTSGRSFPSDPRAG
jgi:hypothetical protein